MSTFELSYFNVSYTIGKLRNFNDDHDHDANGNDDDVHNDANGNNEDDATCTFICSATCTSTIF